MKRKEVLTKRLTRLNNKREKLYNRAQASEDVNEVRTLTEAINDLDDDIADTKAEIEALEEEERSNNPVEKRTEVPAGATLVNGTVVSTTKTEERSEDPYASLEYRKAFMAYAQRGTAIPAKFETRDPAAATTETIGATIPTTVLNEFINGLTKRQYGNLYAKVRKLNVKGGVKIPIAKLQATFHWIAEGAVSERQDGGEVKDFVIFSYHTGEIRVAQSLLSSIVSLDVFETEIVQVMIQAFLKAMDTGIVAGSGDGQMLGLLNDKRVTNGVSMTATQINNWTYWKKNLFAKIPLAYRGGEFIFAPGTVDAYLETMADSNNNPIFHQATALDINEGNRNGRFFGRNVELVEPDVIPDFDSAQTGDVIGIYWQPEQYAINTNMAFTMRRYFDEEKNEWVNKLIVIVDGKPLDTNGVYIITKA